MILHAAAMAALLVDQLAQTPVRIQCVQQAAPESWLKWLLPTIVQTVVSLASITTGVWIAYWSFTKNRAMEHEEWVRDQKRAEWKELLAGVAAIEEIVPGITSALPDYRTLESSVSAILPLLQSTIFVYQTIKSSDFIGRWQSFYQYVSGEFKFTIDADNNLRRGLLEVSLTSDLLTNSARSRQTAELGVRQKFHGLRDELRTLAHKDLGI